MTDAQISTEESNKNVNREVRQQHILHGVNIRGVKTDDKEPSPCYEDVFQPYDPKIHHIDASYISEAFQKYYCGKEQISLEVPLNLSLITDCDVKKRDFYHPVIGRNVLSPRGFTLNCSPPKRPELPLMPPDRILAQASERHLNTASLNPFLAKQLSPHQSIGQFISLSDGTLHTYPLTPQKSNPKYKRSFASVQDRQTNTTHISARNLASPISSFTNLTNKGITIDTHFNSRKPSTTTRSNNHNDFKKAQEIQMRLFPVVDNRTSTPGKQCRCESVPIITAMVTNENLFTQSTQPVISQPRTVYPTVKPSMPPIQRRPSSTYIVGSFPGRIVGEKRPLTTTTALTRTASVRKSSPSPKYQESASKDAISVGMGPVIRRSAPTIVKKPTVRSSLGAWALDQSPPEEIIEKLNREHALPPRYIDFTCKKTVPLYRAYSTGR